jgi:hypothetical protein
MKPLTGTIPTDGSASKRMARAYSVPANELRPAHAADGGL